jgi:uncharacterized protein YndB with AHSA1/START domain
MWTEVSATVPLSPAKAFEVFTHQINTWWPRNGVFPYSFAPETTAAEHICFARNERLHERFADGTDYTIGEVLEWDAPNRIVHEWKAPDWSNPTIVTITFEHVGHHCLVTLRQDSFDEAGVADLLPYYDIGNRQTFASYVAHCNAIHELQMLSADGPIGAARPTTM